MKKNKPFAAMDETVLNNLSHQDFLTLELDDALNSLDDNHRLALTLYYVNGFTTKEISEFLHESEGTIKSRISRAKKQLKHTYYLEGANLI